MTTPRVLSPGEHNAAVRDFFERAREQDPQRYAEVCEKYPVLSKNKIRRIRRGEVTMGLIGLDPTDAARLPKSIAQEFGYDEDEEAD